MVEPVGMTARRLPVVMIVDDTKTNLMILAEALKQDYAILTATDGAEALSLLKQGELPDLILLDVVMPGMDGYEVCRLIKTQESTRQADVLAMTAYPSPKNVQKIIDCGARICLAKPLNMEALLAEVRASL